VQSRRLDLPALPALVPVLKTFPDHGGRFAAGKRAARSSDPSQATRIANLVHLFFTLIYARTIFFPTKRPSPPRKTFPKRDRVNRILFSFVLCGKRFFGNVRNEIVSFSGACFFPWKLVPPPPLMLCRIRRISVEDRFGRPEIEELVPPKYLFWFLW